MVWGAMTDWPASFPSNCPPGDAVDANGRFYRLVDVAPPTADDFLSLSELVAAGKRKPRKRIDLCEAAGVSIFADAQDLQRIRLMAPFADCFVAVGDIDGSGKLKPTPRGPSDSHHTWWVPENDTTWQQFKVVAP